MTTSTDRYKEAVRAVAFGDTENTAQLLRPLLENEAEEFHSFSMAVFVSLIERRLKDDHGLDAIRGFTKEVHDHFGAMTPPVNRLAAEGLIRAVWGEEELLDDIRGRDQLDSAMAIIRKITHDLPEVQDNFEYFLNDAEAIAKTWQEG